MEARSVRALSGFMLTLRASHRGGGRARLPCVRWSGTESTARADGVASPRPLSGVTPDSPKSASEVYRSAGGDEYAISVAANPLVEQSAHRRSANPNRRRHRKARTGEADFRAPRNGSKTQTPSARRLGALRERRAHGPVGLRTSARRRLGLRRENHASGACLTIAASARVSRTPANNYSRHQAKAGVSVETAPPRIGTPAAWFSKLT
jgi:hypothetical protein